jgi:RecA/RadA recombinase
MKESTKKEEKSAEIVPKKITAKDLIDRIKRSSKAEADNVFDGKNIPVPDKFVPAPEPIQKLIGLPGWPVKRISQVSGKPNSGKSTLGTLALVEAQKAGWRTILVDAEKKFAPVRFQKMGGDLDDLIVISETTLEAAFHLLDVTFQVIFSENPKDKVVVVYDSIGNAPARAEAEADPNDKMQLSMAAKIIKRNLRVMVPKWFDKYDICPIFINTNYANLNAPGYTNSGGVGLEYFSSLILQLTRTGNILKEVKKEKLISGIFSKASITKNHMQSGETTLKEIGFKVFAYSVEFKDKVQTDETIVPVSPEEDE